MNYFKLYVLNEINKYRNKPESSRSCRASFKNLGQKFGTKFGTTFGIQIWDRQTDRETDGQTDRQTRPDIELLCN